MDSHLAANNVPPRRSSGAAPLRAHHSVRRTSTIDVDWPNGRAGDARIIARARDVYTPPQGGSPLVLAEDAYQAWLRPDRVIVSIASEPVRPGLAALAGQRVGGGLRQAIEAAVPGERAAATPLHLILDDVAGASLVSGWAWSQWDQNWMQNTQAALKDFDLAKVFRDRAGICTGFAEGSSGLEVATDRSGTPTTDLRHPDDPEGWHRYTDQDGTIAMRRARRIDVQLRQDTLLIDSAFQDSATCKAGGRSVVHEYILRATSDLHSLRLLTVDAIPQVLPFAECPGAVSNLHRLIGVPLIELREKVLAELRGTLGCTHLNDAMRALAETPALSKHLRRF